MALIHFRSNHSWIYTRLPTVDVQQVILCHCNNCKRYTGSAFSANFSVPQSALTWTTEEPKLFIDASDAGRPVRRQFCGDCGSPLTSKPSAGPDVIIMKWGTLNDEDRGRMQDLGAEIYCARRDEYLNQLNDPAVQRIEGMF